MIAWIMVVIFVGCIIKGYLDKKEDEFLDTDGIIYVRWTLLLLIGKFL